MPMRDRNVAVAESTRTPQDSDNVNRYEEVKDICVEICRMGATTRKHFFQRNGKLAGAYLLPHSIIVR